jgi:hypothetical protein
MIVKKIPVEINIQLSVEEAEILRLLVGSMSINDAMAHGLNHDQAEITHTLYNALTIAISSCNKFIKD